MYLANGLFNDFIDRWSTSKIEWNVGSIVIECSRCIYHFTVFWFSSKWKMLWISFEYIHSNLWIKNHINSSVDHNNYFDLLMLPFLFPFFIEDDLKRRQNVDKKSSLSFYFRLGFVPLIDPLIYLCQRQSLKQWKHWFKFFILLPFSFNKHFDNNKSFQHLNYDPWKSSSLHLFII